VIVLGFDTATPATAVGLQLADGTVLTAHDDPQSGQRPGHATRLLPLADQLLEQAGLEWDALQRIAVGLGPGTFTGLRVGIATARGLAQSLSVDLVGVGSLHALAHRAVGERQGHVLAVIDARRGEVFAAALMSGGQLTAPRALAPGDIGDLLVHDREALHDREAGLGHHKPWLAVGDGAILYRSHLEALDIEVPPDHSSLHRIDGAAICQLGLDATPSAPQTVLPDYLRRPDAEIALQGAAV
jgi:tRNA threonylcarbamoyladenosine biosynthesis protein TsaB